MYNKQNFEVAKIKKQDKYSTSPASMILTKNCTWTTDGHRLLLITTPKDAKLEDFPSPGEGRELTGLEKPTSIYADEAQKIARAIPQKTHLPILKHAAILKTEPGNGVIRFFSTDLSTSSVIEAHKTEERIPNISKVAPREKPVFSISFDHTLLSGLLDCISNCLPKTGAVVKIDFFGNNRAARITARNVETGQSIWALIMPMKA